MFTFFLKKFALDLIEFHVFIFLIFFSTKYENVDFFENFETIFAQIIFYILAF